MAKSTVELLVRALLPARSQRHEKPSLNRSRQLIQKAEELLGSHMDQPLRIGQLCREMDVSERTLRHAFDKLTGTSPLAYLKTQRLNRVYRVLRDAEPSEVMIKQVAYANGFYHLGHFCRDYKQMFYESPSDTLKRY
jgi:AraC family ethanolamine operon transcriptional activator